MIECQERVFTMCWALQGASWICCRASAGQRGEGRPSTLVRSTGAYRVAREALRAHFFAVNNGIRRRRRPRSRAAVVQHLEQLTNVGEHMLPGVRHTDQPSAEFSRRLSLTAQR